MSGFITKIGEWWASTQVPAQISEVDLTGLFTNPYFLVPFICLVGYLLYRQSFKYLVLLVLFIGCWAFTGTQYVQELFTSDGVQLNKVLPLVFGAAGVLAVVVYMFLGRSD